MIKKVTSDSAKKLETPIPWFEQASKEHSIHEMEKWNKKLNSKIWT